jgi:hypothetical protein
MPESPRTPTDTMPRATEKPEIDGGPDHNPVIALGSNSTDDGVRYIEGIQLPIVMSSIMTATFLVLLDTTIIATVISLYWPRWSFLKLPKLTNYHQIDRLSPKSHPSFIRYRTLVGTDLPSSCPGTNTCFTLPHQVH